MGAPHDHHLQMLRRDAIRERRQSKRRKRLKRGGERRLRKCGGDGEGEGRERSRGTFWVNHSWHVLVSAEGEAQDRIKVTMPRE